MKKLEPEAIRNTHMSGARLLETTEKISRIAAETKAKDPVVKQRLRIGEIVCRKAHKKVRNIKEIIGRT